MSSGAKADSTGGAGGVGQDSKPVQTEGPDVNSASDERAPIRFAVVGYASEDRKVSTEVFQGLGRTTIVRSDYAPVTEPGAVYFFARALRRRKASTTVISWLGNDDIADRYAASLRALGAGSSGLSCAGTRSPTTHLYYGSDGEVASFFDPGDVNTSVTEAQRHVVGQADAVIIGVAPSDAVLELLSLVPERAFLTWAVKADPAAVTRAVAKALADRANAICLSGGERAFLTEDRGLDLEAMSRRGAVIVTTMSAEGALCTIDGEEFTVPARERIEIHDPTGAGDTFAAGLTVGLARSTTSSRDDCTRVLTRKELARAVASAASDAADLIIERKGHEDAH